MKDNNKNNSKDKPQIEPSIDGDKKKPVINKLLQTSWGFIFSTTMMVLMLYYSSCHAKMIPTCRYSMNEVVLTKYPVRAAEVIKIDVTEDSKCIYTLKIKKLWRLHGGDSLIVVSSRDIRRFDRSPNNLD